MWKGCFDGRAFGKRIEKIDYAADPDVTRRYFYDNNLRVLEEYDAAATPVAQASYIWGNYIDELLAIDDDPAQGDGFEYFVCRDHLYSPTAVIDSTGSITERYDYDVYGQPTIYTGDGGDSDWWDGDELAGTTSWVHVIFVGTKPAYLGLFTSG